MVRQRRRQRIPMLLLAGISITAFAQSETASAQQRFVPSTVSPEAAELIRTSRPVQMGPATTAEWQAAWEAAEELSQPDVEEAQRRYPATIDKISIAGSDHLLLTPSTFSTANEGLITVYIHGGAHTQGSPESTLVVSLPLAHHLGAKVLAVRYPLAWQSPHPTSRDFVVELYKELLETYAPRRIAMAGDSAGGNLLMSAVLRLRDQGVAMPAVLGLISPWADLTKTGDSLTLARGADLLLDYDFNLVASAELYASSQDMKNPSISPLYADFEGGFPPSYISTGTRDLFLSHCARLQRKLIDAGVENKLLIYEGMWHVFQSFAIPEVDDSFRDLAAFFERHLAR